jgi:hypothetical protein
MPREQDPRIRDYILQHVEKLPRSIASHTAMEFSLTRTGVSRYINRLVAAGVLVARGNTKARRYQLIKDVQRGDAGSRAEPSCCRSEAACFLTATATFE